MEPHCLGKPTDPGRSGSDNRRFVEAVLWIARTGSPWRDLPPFFGNWNSVFKRYRDWVKAGVFVRLFEACSDEPSGFPCRVRGSKQVSMETTVTILHACQPDAFIEFRLLFFIPCIQFCTAYQQITAR